MSTAIQFVRIFIDDGTYADAKLVGPWSAFVHQLVTNSAVISDTIFINRSAITKCVLMTAVEGEPEDNLVFLEPKGRS